MGFGDWLKDAYSDVYSPGGIKKNVEGTRKTAKAANDWLLPGKIEDIGKPRKKSKKKSSKGLEDLLKIIGLDDEWRGIKGGLKGADRAIGGALNDFAGGIKPPAKKAAVAPIDPLQQAINAAMGGQSAAPTAAQEKAYARQSQKVINSAILAARASYDDAIVSAKAGYDQADKKVGANADAMQSLMAGSKRGFDAQRQTEQAQIAKSLVDTSAQVGLGDEALGKLGVSGLMGTGQQMVAEADDGAKAHAAAQAASATGISERTAAASSNMASDIAATAALGAQETRDAMGRDREKQINNLRAQRAAAIQGAKATTQGELISARDKQDTARSEAASDQQRMVLELMGIKQRRDDSAADRSLAREKMNMSAQPALKDQIALANLFSGMAGKSVKLTDPESGNDVWKPAFEKSHLDGMASTLGIENPFAPQKRSYSADTSTLSGLLASLLAR